MRSIQQSQTQCPQTTEIIIRTRLGNIPPPTPGIERVTTMKILGVLYEENFTFREHVERMVTQSNQGLYAIRTLRAQGLSGTHLWNVTRALWQEWHMPALPGGVCLTRAVGSASKQSSLKCRSRVYYRVITPPWWSYVCDAADSKLFAAILHNPHHVLHRLLPPVRESAYNLRQRPHDRTIPLIKNIIFNKIYQSNGIKGLLLTLVYNFRFWYFLLTSFLFTALRYVIGRILKNYLLT